MAILEILERWAAERRADGVRRALPPAAYCDAELARLERERVFGRGWINVGHVSQLERPGDYLTFDVAGHPALVVRGRDGALNAFSNVCAHRSSPVAAGCGNRQVFACPYHAWTYGLDGRLVAAPHMDKGALDGIGLAPLRLETWQGLVFVSLDADAAPLGPALAELEPRLSALDLAAYRVTHVEDWEVACNWKVLVENFCESYHVFAVHRETLEAVSPTATTRVRPGGAGFNHHVQQTADAAAVADARRRGVPDAAAAEVHLVCLYPSTTLSFQSRSAVWLSIVPDGPQSLRARQWLALHPDADGTVDADRAQRSAALTGAFLSEDKAIIEGLQKGLAAGTGNRAPLHAWEETNWQFSQYLLRRLGLEAPEVAG